MGLESIYPNNNFMFNTYILHYKIIIKGCLVNILNFTTSKLASYFDCIYHNTIPII